MFSILTFLYGTTVLLFLVLSIVTLYWFYLRTQLCRIKKARSIESGNTHKHEDQLPFILPYTEYKKQYTSRVRSIAVLACAQSSERSKVINEYMETIREQGSFIYHFSPFYGKGSVKATQKLMNDIMRGSYDLVFCVGMGATHVAKHMSLTQGFETPIVFSGVFDSWWAREQLRRPIETMTGVVEVSSWKKRLKLFLKTKPSLKSVLIIWGLNSDIPSINEAKAYLEQFNIKAHGLNPHSSIELLQALPKYAEKIDSIITLSDSISSQIASNIAHFCNEYGVSYFSSQCQDLKQGAAVVVSACKMSSGLFTAKQTLSILEDNIQANDVSIQTVEHKEHFEASFNSDAMQQQGLDPSRIADIALENGITAETYMDK